MTLLFFNNHSKAQNVGSASLSLGSISNANQDIFAIYNNPSLLDYSKKLEFASHFYIPYGIKEISQVTFCAKIPNKYASIGFGLSNRGSEFFNSQNIIISIGRKSRDLSFGFSTELRQINIHENGNYRGIILNAAASSSIIPKLEFSMFISNLNQAGIGLNKKEIFASHIKIAGKYQASEKLYLYSEADMQLEQSLNSKMGIEYWLLENFIIRSGLNSNPINPSFGIALSKEKWCFNQSIDYNQDLGFSHSLSLTYDMAKKL